MCDYSLHAVATRPAQVGETLITTTFRGTSTRGFASEREPAVAVCMLPGTELAFAEDIRYDNRMRSAGSGAGGSWYCHFFRTPHRGAVGGQQGYMAKGRTRHRARTVYVQVWLAHHHGRRSRDLATIPRGVVYAGQPAVGARLARGVSSGGVRNTGQSLN